MLRGGAPKGTCRDAALRLLGLRAHGRAELERKLTRRGWPVEEVAGVLARLAGSGLLDDAAAAASVVRGEISRGRGKRRAASLLASRGVGAEEAQGALAAASPEEEAAALRAALAKRRRTLPAGLTPAERSRKLLAHLVRRGFAVSAVLDALRAEGESTDDEIE